MGLTPLKDLRERAGQPPRINDAATRPPWQVGQLETTAEHPAAFSSSAVVPATAAVSASTTSTTSSGAWLASTSR